MNRTMKLTLVMLLLVGAAPVARAQSDYTTGTISNSVAAGYPSPYGAGGGLYAYAPGFRAHSGARHDSRRLSTSTPRHDHALYDDVPSDPLGADPRFSPRY
jgi:hypothetical protein